MPPSPETRWVEAAWKMRQRRETDSVLFRHMLQVRDRYNAPTSFALPDVNGEPEIYAPVPMLLADAIDSHASRASSQDPNIIVPAIDGTKPTGKRSIEFANIRRQALQASWYENGLTDLILPRAYRQLAGYGTWNMIVVPDYEAGCARIEMRDALTAYPELRTPEDTRPPLDCGYVYGRSTVWLTKKYPQAKEWARNAKVQDDDLWDVVEWVDPEWVLIGVIGPRKVTGTGNVLYPGAVGNDLSAFENGMLLKSWENKAGMTPVATPRRATLDQVFGQVAQMVPIADLYGRLSALNFIAAEKEVFPAIALIGNQIGRVPTLEGGEWADGRSDKINTVLDGDVKVVQGAPGPMTRAALSDTERAIRQSTGLSGLLSGDPSLGSMRSGQTINSFASLALDPHILDSHRLTKRSLAVLNEAILATEEGCWPSKTYTVFPGPSSNSLVKYTPEVHFEGFYKNAVDYGMQGMDAAQAGVAALQLNASNIMSKHTTRRKSPLIDDPEAEHRQIVLEQTEDAIVGAFTQHIFDGTTPLIDAIPYYKALRDGDEVVDAVEAADKAARERQAKQAPPPDPAMGMGAAPEAMAGLAMPGSGAESLPPAIPPAPPAQNNLEDILMTLGRPPRMAGR